MVLLRMLKIAFVASKALLSREFTLIFDYFDPAVQRQSLKAKQTESV